ncbi:MAG: ABC transporter substrate-binding protein, partial [Anaerotignum sp.]|nr:ABC transporter substrate-binding protein [Anaerotignum sp.]
MKKMMKLTALILTAAMAMTGCGGGGSEDASSGEATYTVGIVQQMEHAALDAATQGFQDKLTELLGDDVAFDYQN